jgi:hypothetical protein
MLRKASQVVQNHDMSTHALSRKPRHLLFWMVIVLLLATAVRLYNIDFHALWFDEGVSITFAHLPLQDLMHYTILWEEVNPPIYRQALGLWTSAVGTSAFTVRWFSGWLGLLAVALTYQLGQKLKLEPNAALGGAVLVAIAPMQVFYSQEAKGYTFIQVCILTAIWLWLSISGKKRPTGWHWISLSILLALAIGSHSTVWLMIGTMAFWAVVWERNRWSGWFLVIGSVGLAWLIWFVTVAETVMRGAATSAISSSMVPRSPPTYLDAMLREFAAGPVAEIWVGWTTGAIILLLAGLGLWRGQAPRRTKWLLVSWTAFPILVGMGVQVVVPFFFPRFLLYVAPALMLMTSLGLEALPRRWMAITTTCIVTLLMAFSLRAQYMRPSDPATDYRPLAATLARRIHPEDALIYSYSWQPGFLDAYLPDDLRPTYYLSFFPPETIDEDMGSILSQHQRVWLVTYQLGVEDPIHATGQWLLAHAATPGSEWYGDGQLSLFLAPEAVVNPGPTSEVADFDGERITLTYAPVETRAAPGEPVGVALTWEASEPIAERFVVFLHLLNNGSPEPLAQQDSQPLNNLSPTYEWTSGEPLQGYRALWLPTSLPQGETLRLVVGLYDGDTLERVPVDSGGDSVQIGTIIVDPTTPQW